MHTLSNLEKKSFRADLHCHSSFSDGTKHPVDLILEAKRVGLSALSITDHDTVGAYETAFSIAKEHGILLGTGVELSCNHKGTSVHLLGYDVDIENQDLLSFCKRQQERRYNRNLLILNKLARLNMPITLTELESACSVSDTEKKSSFKTIGRPHIAKIMQKKGYVRTIQEAFSLFIGDGKCCFVEGEIFTVKEGVEIIHKASGKAFIAHPHLFKNAAIVKDILFSYPIEGLECFYARCSPEKEKRWLKIAREKRLLISGGSDYHGEIKAGIPLGCSWVSEEFFYKIFQKI